MGIGKVCVCMCTCMCVCVCACTCPRVSGGTPATGHHRRSPLSPALGMARLSQTRLGAPLLVLPQPAPSCPCLAGMRRAPCTRGRLLREPPTPRVVTSWPQGPALTGGEGPGLWNETRAPRSRGQEQNTPSQGLGPRGHAAQATVTGEVAAIGRDSCPGRPGVSPLLTTLTAPAQGCPGLAGWAQVSGCCLMDDGAGVRAGRSGAGQAELSGRGSAGGQAGEGARPGCRTS